MLPRPGVCNILLSDQLTGLNTPDLHYIDILEEVLSTQRGINHCFGL